jgi:hypothetical protein
VVTPWPGEEAGVAPVVRDRLAVVGIVLWAASVLLFVGAILLGMIVAANGPGGDTDASWAPLLYPAFSLVIGVPLGIAAIIVAAVSLARRRRRKWLAITTIVLAGLPGAIVLLFLLAREVMAAVNS